MLQLSTTNRFIPTVLAASMSCVMLTACGVDDKPTLTIKKEEKNPLVQGQLRDSNVAGATVYQEGKEIGKTDEKGLFKYKKGLPVTFKLGKLTLGTAQKAYTKEGDVFIFLPYDLADNPEDVAEIAQTLQSLDKDDNPDNGIRIDETKAEQLTEGDLTAQGTTLENTVKEDLPNEPIVSKEDAMAHLEKTKKKLEKIAITAMPALGQAGLDKYEDGIFIENKFGIKSCDKATINDQGKVVIPGLKDDDHCGLLVFTVTADMNQLFNTSKPVTADYKLVSKDGRDVSEILRSGTPATGSISLDGQHIQQTIYFELKSDGKAEGDWNLALEFFNASDNVTLKDVENNPSLNKIVVKDATGANPGGGNDTPTATLAISTAESIDLSKPISGNYTEGQDKASKAVVPVYVLRSSVVTDLSKFDESSLEFDLVGDNSDYEVKACYKQPVNPNLDAKKLSCIVAKADKKNGSVKVVAKAKVKGATDFTTSNEMTITFTGADDQTPVVNPELKLADKTEFKISLDNMKTASEGLGKGYLIAYDPYDKSLAGTINNNIHAIYPFANVTDKYAHVKYADAKWKDNVSFEIDGSNGNYEIIRTQAGADKSIYTLKQLKPTKEGLTINVLVDGVKQSSFKVVVNEKGEVAEPTPTDNKFVVTGISKEWSAPSNNTIDFEQTITDEDFAKIKSITIGGKTFDKAKFTRALMNKALRSNDAEVLKALKTATKADVKVNLEGDSGTGDNTGGGNTSSFSQPIDKIKANWDGSAYDIEFKNKVSTEEFNKIKSITIDGKEFDISKFSQAVANYNIRTEDAEVIAALKATTKDKVVINMKDGADNTAQFSQPIDKIKANWDGSAYDIEFKNKVSTEEFNKIKSITIDGKEFDISKFSQAVANYNIRTEDAEVIAALKATTKDKVVINMKDGADNTAQFSQPIDKIKANWDGSAYDIEFKNKVSTEEFNKIKSITIDGKEFDISKFSQAVANYNIRTEDAEVIAALKATTKDKVVINMKGAGDSGNGGSTDDGNTGGTTTNPYPIKELKANWDGSAYDIILESILPTTEFNKIKSITIDGKEFDISKFSQAIQNQYIRTEDADAISALKATTKDKVVINMKDGADNTAQFSQPIDKIKANWDGSAYDIEFKNKVSTEEFNKIKSITIDGKEFDISKFSQAVANYNIRTEDAEVIAALKATTKDKVVINMKGAGDSGNGGSTDNDNTGGGNTSSFSQPIDKIKANWDGSAYDIEFKNKVPTEEFNKIKSITIDGKEFDISKFSQAVANYNIRTEDAEVIAALKATTKDKVVINMKGDSAGSDNTTGGATPVDIDVAGNATGAELQTGDTVDLADSILTKYGILLNKATGTTNAGNAYIFKNLGTINADSIQFKLVGADASKYALKDNNGTKEVIGSAQDKKVTAGTIEVEITGTYGNDNKPFKGTYRVVVKDSANTGDNGGNNGNGGSTPTDPTTPSNDTKAKINDTGVTYSADLSKGNSDSCSSETQDCNFGRDKDGSGFDLVKLNVDGKELDANAENWDCVKDKVTGLVWERKTYTKYESDKDDKRDYRDSQWDYGYYDAMQGLGTKDNPETDWDKCGGLGNCTTANYTAKLNENKLCGISNWRLPTRLELFDVMNLNSQDGDKVMHAELLTSIFTVPADPIRINSNEKQSDYVDTRYKRMRSSYWTQSVAAQLEKRNGYNADSTVEFDHIWTLYPSGQFSREQVTKPAEGYWSNPTAAVIAVAESK